MGARGVPVVSGDPDVQARYAAMRAAGESHNLAEVLAVGAFPASRTDREFNRGRCNGNQFEGVPGLGDYLRGKAEAVGVNTTGKTYLRGLADYPGDPAAWVADRSDVLRVAREKGFKVSGAVEYTPPEAAPMPDVRVAPEIVEAAVADRLAADPGLRREDVYDEAYRTRLGRSEPIPDFEGGEVSLPGDEG